MMDVGMLDTLTKAVSDVGMLWRKVVAPWQRRVGMRLGKEVVSLL